jgi:hypothetical protein
LTLLQALIGASRTLPIQKSSADVTSTYCANANAQTKKKLNRGVKNGQVDELTESFGTVRHLPLIFPSLSEPKQRHKAYQEGGYRTDDE